MIYNDLQIYNVAVSQLCWTTAHTGGKSGDNNNNLPQRLSICHHQSPAK